MTDAILFLCEETSRVARNSGIQRVVRMLAKALLNLDKKVIPVKLGPNGFEVLTDEELEFLGLFNGPRVDQWTTPETIFIEGQYITKNILIAELTTYRHVKFTEELFNHCTDNGLNIVSIFFDAIPILFKGSYSKEWSESHLDYMINLSRSNVVLPISKNAKNDYLKFVKKPINSNLIVEEELLPTKFIEMEPVPTKINNTKVIDILCVSTIEIRKNHERLLNGFHKAKMILSEKGYEINLTLIGHIDRFWGDYAKIIESKISEYGVVLIENASDNELVDAYKKADFSIYPSLYEGYGLPIVESLFLNTPVACSGVSSMGEVAQIGGCITFDPHEENNIRDAIITLSTKQYLRDRLGRQINSIQWRSWNDYANNVISYIERGQK